MKKRVIIFMALAILASLFLSVTSYASDVGNDTEATELEIYITEKVMPVVVGVLTSAVALFTTLASIAKSLKALKETKSTFETEATQRANAFQSNTELLEGKVQEIKQTVSNVPGLEGQLAQLQGEVAILIRECNTLAQILTLGFSANSEIIKTGKGKKMALLLEKLNCALPTEETRDEKN